MLRFWQRDQDPGGVVLGGVALGERPWLVLGGGGLKGLTHLGAIRALQRHGFEPTGIVGTSIGALVGACLSAGRDVEELIATARSLTRMDIARLRRRAVWVNGVRARSVFMGDELREYIGSVLPGATWEDLEIRFQANAVELGSGCTEWFGIGARTDVRPADAIYASAALPVFYPPAALPGGLYVDGGVEFALPLARAVELGATGIVAVDPGSTERANAREVVEGGILAVHQRIFSIMSGRLRREAVDQWDGPPLLYLRPDLAGYGTFDFGHIDYFLEEGERAMAERLGDPPPPPAPDAAPLSTGTSSEDGQAP